MDEQILSFENVKEILNTPVIYQDYLGIQRFAVIGWLEPYLGDDSENVYWLYLVDDDSDYNNKQIVVNFGTSDKPDMRTINYADMRLSTEVSPDKWR